MKVTEAKEVQAKDRLPPLEEPHDSPEVFVPGSGTFSRLYKGLPPYRPRSGAGPSPNGTATRNALMKQAEDAYDDVDSEDDIILNRTFPAAYTFFSQFVAHDISLDPSQFGDGHSEPTAQANVRTARLDLDHVYGGDPDVNALYYVHDEGRNTYKFLTENRNRTIEHEGMTLSFRQEDLVRLKGRAVIPDKRDDLHVIVSQLHLAIQRLHNANMDQVLANGLTGRPAFFEAQKLTRWFYQYVLVEDLLPRMLGKGPNMAVLQKCREEWARWRLSGGAKPASSATVPVEFSLGAFRLGHCTIRSGYQVNGKAPLLPLLGPNPSGPGATEAAGASPKGLFGFRELDRLLSVNWSYLIKGEGSEVEPQYARVFTRKLSRTMNSLPVDMNVPRGGLAAADLERGWRMDLASGQDIARAAGVPDELVVLGNDPLWYYMMKESANRTSVGPLAALILSKVFMDLLHLDPTSYLSVDPQWVPKDVVNPREALSGLLRAAGMPFADAKIFERK